MPGRRTFVVHAGDGGPATVEDVRTGRLVAVADLDRVGAQISDWLDGDATDPASNGIAEDHPGL
jgi:hypothetical protein